MAFVLVIDDDKRTNQLYCTVVSHLGHDTISALSLAEGMQKATRMSVDLVLLDVHLPDGNGIDMLPALLRCRCEPVVVMVSGQGDPDAAEAAIRSGAWDYLAKPAPVETMRLTIERALKYRAAKAEKRPTHLRRDNIIGSSYTLNATLERVAQAAASSANVLIWGETGTGKELIARAIHANSQRAKRRFVVVDCAALPETLVESTLFGHVKGAYTGADAERDGLIKQADGGTLFLDEIGELPLAAQKSLLRVIQERRYRPVRARHELTADFRLIAATNRDLEAQVKAGEFREDLLFRLRGVSLTTPPLRDRKEDLKPLCIYYMNKLCDIYAAESKGFATDFFEALEQYDWPGNVRELFHTLEEVFSAAGSEPTLFPQYLPIHIRAAMVRQVVDQHPNSPPPSAAGWDLELGSLNKDNFLSLAAFRERTERAYLEKLTRLTGGSRKEACRISGISRTRLFELLKKYEISKSLRKVKAVCQ
jgi:two-component system, NtrC family, response regulator